MGTSSLTRGETLEMRNRPGSHSEIRQISVARQRKRQNLEHDRGNRRRLLERLNTGRRAARHDSGSFDDRTSFVEKPIQLCGLARQACQRNSVQPSTQIAKTVRPTFAIRAAVRT
jgi:hypothetical protein